MKLTLSTISLCVLAASAIAQPAPPSLKDICPNYSEVAARTRVPYSVFKKGITIGEVTVAFTLGADDTINDIAVVTASDPTLESWGIRIVEKLHCRSGGKEQRLSVPFSWRYTNTPLLRMTSGPIGCMRSCRSSPR